MRNTLKKRLYSAYMADISRCEPLFLKLVDGLWLKSDGGRLCEECKKCLEWWDNKVCNSVPKRFMIDEEKYNRLTEEFNGIEDVPCGPLS